MFRRQAGSVRQDGSAPEPRRCGVPEAGDVLVKRLPRRPPVYALSVVPNLSQITFDTYVQAIAHADRFARRQGVAVWTIEP